MDKILRPIMCALTCVCAYPAKAHDIFNYIASQETRCLFCSYTRNSSQQKTLRIESPLPLNHPCLKMIGDDEMARAMVASESEFFSSVV